MEKEGGYSLSSDCFLCGAENYPLHKAMVDHGQQRVKARGDGKVSDEVTRDLLEGARGMGFYQSEQGHSGVSVQFVLLAHDIAFDIFAHKLYKTQPL